MTSYQQNKKIRQLEQRLSDLEMDEFRLSYTVRKLTEENLQLRLRNNLLESAYDNMKVISYINRKFI